MTDESRPKNSISADWVLKRIQEGKKVRLRNAVIEGDLDLNKLELPTRRVERTEFQKQCGLSEDVKTVDSSIDIANSTIQGAINFNNSTFTKDALFVGATFIGKAEFHGTTFSENAWFIGATFRGDAGFNRATFGKDAWFVGATFIGKAEFYGTTFSENAGFGRVTFGKIAWFDRAIFGKDASFDRATFSKGTEFRYATFSRYAGFDRTTFSEDARFDRATFSGDAKFDRTTFRRDARFDGTIFNGEAKFERATFRKDVTFFETQFGQKLDLNRAKYERAYIRWETVNNHLNYQGAAYLTLAKNFKNLDYFEDADACYYQYRRIAQSKKSWYGWSKLLDIIAWVTCGYGVKVWRPVFCVLVCVVIFASFYGLFNGIANVGSSEISPLSINAAPLVTQNMHPTEVYAGGTSWAEYLYFSAAALTGSTPSEVRPLGEWKYVAVIERLMGYLFLSLFDVVLTRKMIR